MKLQELIGLWQLKSFVLQVSPTEHVSPFGENPRGLLHYSEDGFMSVSLAAKDRKPVGKNSSFYLNADELRQLYEKFASYCGRYELIDNKVYHHIKMMSFVDWENKTQVREVAFDGEYLTLTHDIEFQGRTVDSTLIWEKTNPTSL